MSDTPTGEDPRDPKGHGYYYPAPPQPDPNDTSAPYLLQNAPPIQQVPLGGTVPGTASDTSAALQMERELRKRLQIGPATGQEPLTAIPGRRGLARVTA